MTKKTRITDADFEAICLGAGLIKPAIADARMVFSEEDNGIVSVSEFLTHIRESGTRPQWWPNTFARDSLDPKLIEAACGDNPTLAARADLLAVAGPELTAELLRDWHCSNKPIPDGHGGFKLAPGKNPKADTEKAAEIVKRDDDGRNNPFNPAKKYGSEAVRQNEIVKYIRFAGAKAAAACAARYGVDLAGRPLRRSA